MAGQPFALDAHTAAQWLGALATDLDNLYGVMPGLVADEDLDRMVELVDTVPDLETRWIHAARTAVGRAGGRDWWWTVNLARKALGTWIYTNGILLRESCHSKELALPDWLDAAYTLWWQHASEEQRIKLDLELSMPPKGSAVRTPRGHTKEMVAAFAAD